MKFGLTVEASIGIEGKTNIIQQLSDEISAFIKNRNYGHGVQKLLIGVICVAPEFEFFTKVRKPRYTAYRKYVRYDTEFVEDRIFCFDLKLDYVKFRSQTDDQNRKMLAKEILNSLSNLDALPKKVKDFDKEQFRKDMKIFFEEQKLIDI